jgi:hypothetical protein
MRFAAIAALLASAAAPAAWAAEEITYRYDARGRLVAIERTGNVNNGVVTTHTYDKANNRTSKTTSGGTQSALSASEMSPSDAVVGSVQQDDPDAPPLG